MKKFEKLFLMIPISFLFLTGVTRGNEEAEAAIDQYKAFDMAKIEGVVKAFLESESVTERAKFIRHAERVKPLMKKFYEGEKITAEGFEGLDKSEISYRDSLLTAMVQTGDFLQSPIAVERVGEGDKASHLVDWESWVGYCDLKPKEMQKKKPVKPTEMRVILSLDRYYNYEFSDETKWKSYRMALRNSEFVFQGYARKGSEVEKALLGIKDDQSLAPYLIKVAYPEEAKAKNLVEIVEVISSGWIHEARPKKQ